jgi:hypothetical protein
LLETGAVVSKIAMKMLFGEYIIIIFETGAKALPQSIN